MVDHVQEFREFISFTKGKVLKNAFSQVHSKSLIKLGIFLRDTEINHPQFKKWMQIFHKSCKKSKSIRFSNTYLLSFQMKLTKISKKLINEIILKNSNKILSDALCYKPEKDFNCGKLRKLIFMKKFTRFLPIEIKRLIADISFYIGESVNEKEMDGSDDAINVKRKRFARKIKESLNKYFIDFNSIYKIENELDKQENSEDEIKELNECLLKFDCNIVNNSNNNSSNDIVEKISVPFHFDDKLEKFLLSEEADFNDFDIIDEWDEGLSNNVPINYTDQLISSLTEINNNILENLTSDETLPLNMNDNLVDINYYLDSCPGNRTISNIQESFLFNFINKINEILLKIKSNEKEKIESKNGTIENLLCNNHKLYTKPKPSIKIMNLKKPHAYLSIESIVDNKSSEINLENIPLPMKSHNKINSDDNIINKNAQPNTLQINKEPSIIEERSDVLEDEMIPLSILDFSDVLNDEFDGKENHDSSSNICELSTSVIVNDDCTKKLSENRSIILKESKILENIENFEENDYNFESDCNFTVQYNRPENIACKSNYSIFSIDDKYNNTEFRQNLCRQYDEYIYNNEGDFDDYYSSNRNRTNNYYNNSHNNNYRHATMNNNNYNINNYRNYDRGNRRLFRNFLRYTCQSNNTDRQWVYESQTFDNDN